MSSLEGEENYDEYEHYNYEQDKAMNSGHSGQLINVLINFNLIFNFFRQAEIQEGGRNEHQQT